MWAGGEVSSWISVHENKLVSVPVSKQCTLRFILEEKEKKKRTYFFSFTGTQTVTDCL